MKKNMAVLDRFSRLVLAVVITVLVFTKEFGFTTNIGLLAVAGIFMLTALAGRCPLYTLLGLDTRQFRY